MQDSYIQNNISRDILFHEARNTKEILKRSSLGKEHIFHYFLDSQNDIHLSGTCRYASEGHLTKYVFTFETSEEEKLKYNEICFSCQYDIKDCDEKSLLYFIFSTNNGFSLYETIMKLTKEIITLENLSSASLWNDSASIPLLINTTKNEINQEGTGTFVKEIVSKTKELEEKYNTWCDSSEAEKSLKRICAKNILPLNSFSINLSQKQEEALWSLHDQSLEILCETSSYVIVSKSNVIIEGLRFSYPRYVYRPVEVYGRKYENISILPALAFQVLVEKGYKEFAEEDEFNEGEILPSSYVPVTEKPPENVLEILDKLYGDELQVEESPNLSELLEISKVI